MDSMYSVEDASENQKKQYNKKRKDFYDSI